MREGKLAKIHEEEFQYLKERINAIPKKDTDTVNKISESETRAIAESVREKIEILKICYSKSDVTIKESIHQLIRYPQLRYFLADAETKETKLDDIVYTPKMIHNHLNRLPDKPRVLEFYGFYFGRYRLFFRCFGRDFLEQEKLDKEFLDDIFSPKEGDYYVSGKKLEIAGATIIDKEFIEDIKTRGFSMAEFYTAIQAESSICQWYGIIQGWDVERKVYHEAKSVVENSFKKERKNKISAIVHGDGGCGKSTLLRKISLELSVSEKFKIIWLYDFDEFLNGKYLNNIPSGWEMIKNDFSNQYIIFIEDWYSRVDYNGTTDSTKFLKQTQNIRNVRIVIGDRYIHGKHYLDHIYDDSNKFLLRPAENRYILEKVIQKFSDWQPMINENLFDKLGEASLFMLLFIIAKASENNKLTELDLSEPHKEFQNIVKSNLNQLVNLKCSGLAKALHNWSCIYSELRISLSYDALLLLAENFNKQDDKKPQDYKNLKLNSQVTRILNTYIGIRIQNEKYNHQVFYFNHDILSDDGLSKISFPDWDEYDDDLLKIILNVLVKKGDDASASVFLQRMIQHKPSLFEGKQEKLEYINKLIDRKVQHFNYTSLLGKNIPLSIDELDGFAEKLWNIGNYYNVFWSYVLKQPKLKDKWSENILRSFSTSNPPPEIISLAMFHYRDKIKNNLFQNTCKKILQEDILLTHPTLVSAALKLSADKEEEEKELVQQACQKILEKVANGKILSISHNIISLALKLSIDKGKNGLVQQACQKILEKVANGEILSISHNIISPALKLSIDKGKNGLVQQACQKILEKIANDGISSVSPDFVSPALKLSIDKEENGLVQQICKKILEKVASDGISNISPDIVSSTLYICTDDELKKQVTNYFIKNKKSEVKYNGLIYQSLQFHALQESIPIFVEDFVNEIINNFRNAENKNKHNDFIYFNLLKIPFHSIPLWKSQTQWIIQNWKKIPRSNINNVLLSYRNYHAYEILTVCKEILINWEKEIHSEFFTMGRKKQYANHVISSMGHLDLRSEILQIANEINNATLNEGLKIPEYVKEVVENIVYNGIFPEWTKSNNE